MGLQCWSQAGRVVLGFPTVGQGRFRVTRFLCLGTGHVPLVGSFAGRWVLGVAERCSGETRGKAPGSLSSCLLGCEM